MEVGPDIINVFHVVAGDKAWLIDTVLFASMFLLVLLEGLGEFHLVPDANRISNTYLLSAHTLPLEALVEGVLLNV